MVQIFTNTLIARLLVLDFALEKISQFFRPLSLFSFFLLSDFDVGTITEEKNRTNGEGEKGGPYFGSQQFSRRGEQRRKSRVQERERERGQSRSRGWCLCQ